MAITRSTKELSTTTIDCGDTFDVILTLGAEPDIANNPTDIILILDRSGSMEQSLPALKNAANVFIDIIDESTDSISDGTIGGGSRIGIVSFSDQATQDTGKAGLSSNLPEFIDGAILQNETTEESSIAVVHLCINGSFRDKNRIRREGIQIIIYITPFNVLLIETDNGIFFLLLQIHGVIKVVIGHGVYGTFSFGNIDLVRNTWVIFIDLYRDFIPYTQIIQICNSVLMQSPLSPQQIKPLDGKGQPLHSSDLVQTGFAG